MCREVPSRSLLRQRIGITYPHASVSKHYIMLKTLADNPRKVKEVAMINGFCFFEIPGDDLGKLQEFYGAMFDWSFEKAPGDFRYYMVHTPGETIKGGLTARQDPQHQLVNYVKVASVEEAVAKAGKLGATVVVPRKPVPGVGWYAVLKDPEGNRLGLWEDDTHAA